MGERRSQRFRVGRRRDRQSPAADAAVEAPCLPCAAQASLRAFALNPATIDRIADDFVPTLDPEVADAIVGGEVVLIDRRSRTSSLLNATAALIWASIDGRSSVRAIADDLATETGADREVIATDVRSTIARFIDGRVVLDTLPPPDGADDGAADDGAVVADEDPAHRGAVRAREGRRRDRVGSVFARRSWQLDEARRCAGASVAIRTDSTELASLLGPALAPLPSTDPADADEVITVLDRGRASERRFRLLLGTEVLQCTPTAAAAADAVLAQLDDLAITRTRDRIVLHAGAVERDGTIIVVAGPSGRGKSTITAALVRSGWAYLTDEVVPIDPTTLAVLPYAKPLELDPASCELLGIDATASALPATRDKVKVTIDQLGTIGGGTGSVGLIVLLAEPTGAVPPPQSPAELLVEILGNTFDSTFERGADAQVVLDQLVTVAATVPVITLDRRPIDDAVRVITEHGRGAPPAGAETGEPSATVAP